MSESLIHRVLGAVQFVDAATRRPVESRLELRSDKRMTWRRNASGAYVLWRAEGLESLTGHGPLVSAAELDALFEAQPATVAPGSHAFVVSVEDPSGEYLGRAFEIALPRGASASFELVEVALHRSTAARRLASAAAAYVFVHDGRGKDGRLPGARVTISVDGNEVARGLTGPNGEALLEAVALPSFVAASEGGPVTTSEIHAKVRAAVLPTLLARDDSASPWRLAKPPNPDSAAFGGTDARASASQDLILSLGRPAKLSLSISL